MSYPTVHQTSRELLRSREDGVERKRDAKQSKKKKWTVLNFTASQWGCGMQNPKQTRFD